MKSSPKGSDGRRPVPILYVIGSMHVGGAEGHLARVVRQLDRTLWSPSIFTVARYGDLDGELEIRDGPVYSPRTPRFLGGRSQPVRIARIVSTFIQLVWHLVRHRPRLVHYFLPVSYVLGLPATFVAHTLTLFLGTLPVRVMSRRSLNLYQRERPLLGKLERLLHPGCSKVIGNSRAVVAELQAEGVPTDRLRLVYNGIEIPPAETAVRHTLRADLGIPNNVLMVTKIANLIPYKGHRDLLAAFAVARDMVRLKMVLCLVGRDDGIGHQLEADARQLGIEGCVKFLGLRDDVADILSVSDIGVLCSHQEGFSNAVLEGMAAGLPMVVTRVGGNPEAIIDGESGLVVEPHAPQDLAKALARLASDPDLRQRLGTGARKRVEANFSLLRCQADYERLYAELTGVDRSPV